MSQVTTPQIESFIKDGYIKIDNAFPKSLADEIVDHLWQHLSVNRLDSSTWNKPVIRLGDFSHAPFVACANTEKLIHAYNQLVGKDKWLPRKSLGTFPIRFPSKHDAGDTGWHVDASFPGDDPHDYLKWRINVKSKGRGLLMLFLFSDIGEHDAPTKIRQGSHIHVARILSAYGDQGLTAIELASRLEVADQQNEILATGQAGTVYLCHPFIVHAAQRHQGTAPRFLAQPPLQIDGDFDVYGNNHHASPVEIAIRRALEPPSI